MFVCLFVRPLFVKYWARYSFFRLLQFCTVQFETLPDDQVWDQESKCYFPTRYELEGLAQFMFFGDLSEIWISLGSGREPTKFTR